MNLKLFLIVFGLFLVFNTNAQDISQDISRIKKWYAEIENNSDNYIKTEDVSWSSDEYYNGCGEQLTTFKNKTTNQYDKIVSYCGRDWYERTASYYFHEGILFFVFIQDWGVEEWYTPEELGISENDYVNHGGIDKTDKKEEYRLYFANDTCIRSLYKKVVYQEKIKPDMSSAPNENRDPEQESYTEYVKLTDDMINFLNDRDE